METFLDNVCKCSSTSFLVITHKSKKPGESGLLDDGALQILRCAQDDKPSDCHPERSEGSLSDLWVITSQDTLSAYLKPCYT